MILEIPQSDFVLWKNDSTTKFIFEYFKAVKEFYLESMTSKQHLRDPNGLLKLNEMRGYVDAIDDFLNMEPIADLNLSEEEVNEEIHTGRV